MCCSSDLSITELNRFDVLANNFATNLRMFNDKYTILKNEVLLQHTRQAIDPDFLKIQSRAEKALKELELDYNNLPNKILLQSSLKLARGRKAFLMQELQDLDVEFGILTLRFIEQLPNDIERRISSKIVEVQAAQNLMRNFHRGLTGRNYNHNLSQRCIQLYAEVKNLLTPISSKNLVLLTRIKALSSAEKGILFGNLETLEDRIRKLIGEMETFQAQTVAPQRRHRRNDGELTIAQAFDRPNSPSNKSGTPTNKEKAKGPFAKSKKAVNYIPQDEVVGAAAGAGAVAVVLARRDTDPPFDFEMGIPGTVTAPNPEVTNKLAEEYAQRNQKFSGDLPSDELPSNDPDVSDGEGAEIASDDDSSRGNSVSRSKKRGVLPDWAERIRGGAQPNVHSVQEGAGAGVGAGAEVDADEGDDEGVEHDVNLPGSIN